jgi:RsiW-degrading membrane proteinase PrsW (M82 family)
LNERLGAQHFYEAEPPPHHCGREPDAICATKSRPHFRSRGGRLSKTLGGIKRMNIATEQKRRPLVVTLALALFVANQLPNLVLDAIRGNWHSIYFYIIFVVLLVVLFVPVWLIFRGNNWPRWFLAALFLVGFCADLVSFINSHSSHSASWLALRFLKPFVDLVALIALFLPSSNRWFRNCKHGAT